MKNTLPQLRIAVISLAVGLVTGSTIGFQDKWRANVEWLPLPFISSEMSLVLGITCIGMGVTLAFAVLVKPRIDRWGQKTDVG